MWVSLMRLERLEINGFKSFSDRSELAFDKGVNVTLGLPIVRTSVDHGTAFDIAWKGVARPESLFEAIRAAIRLAPQSASPPT